MISIFEQFSEKQKEKLSEWAKEQDNIILEKQKLSTDPMIREMAKSGAYYGATGGAFTYSFTPTSLGTVMKVKHGLTNNEIDLTEYSEW